MMSGRIPGRSIVTRTRLEAFSDGVFAVAITLLALDLPVAHQGHGPLLHQLADHWPSFVAYVISFFTIGVIWVNHHALVGSITVVDRTLLFLNLLLLLFVGVIPFATATMAAYLTQGGADAQVAMALYVTAFEGMSLSIGALFEWTLHHGHAGGRLPQHVRRAARWRFLVGLLVYPVGIAVAFLNPMAALVITGMVAVYYSFERTPSVAAGAENTPG